MFSDFLQLLTHVLLKHAIPGFTNNLKEECIINNFVWLL